MKCEACDKEYVNRELAYFRLCLECEQWRKAATDAAGAQWDREHRKPKEIVIEVEVPAEWVAAACLTSRPMPVVTALLFSDPVGRLVLKARKETP